MKLPFPFYSNDGDGNQCFQACIRSVLNYYELPDKSLDELDALSGREPNGWTWSTQVVHALDELGVKNTLYTAGEISEGLDVKNYLEELFGEHAEKYIKLTNIESVQTSTQWVISNERYEKRTVSKEEIREWLDEKQPVIALLDWNKVTDREGGYQGHAVVITGYDENHFFVHHNGPRNAQAHLPIPYEKFFEAQTPATDHDLIRVQGTNQ